MQDRNSFGASFWGRFGGKILDSCAQYQKTSEAKEKPKAQKI
jgi:hypothetical protein